MAQRGQEDMVKVEAGEGDEVDQESGEERRALTTSNTEQPK